MDPFTSCDFQLLERLYERFNARDMEALLATLHASVTWANGWEGGYVHGHADVRTYWTRQWAVIDPQLKPLSFRAGPDGQIAVKVHQSVHDCNGKLLSDKVVEHGFHIEGGLIRRFDILPPQRGQ